MVTIIVYPEPILNTWVVCKSDVEEYWVIRRYATKERAVKEAKIIATRKGYPEPNIEAFSASNPDGGSR